MHINTSGLVSVEAANVMNELLLSVVVGDTRVPSVVGIDEDGNYVAVWADKLEDPTFCVSLTVNTEKRHIVLRKTTQNKPTVVEVMQYQWIGDSLWMTTVDVSFATVCVVEASDLSNELVDKDNEKLLSD